MTNVELKSVLSSPAALQLDDIVDVCSGFVPIVPPQGENITTEIPLIPPIETEESNSEAKIPNDEKPAEIAEILEKTLPTSITNNEMEVDSVQGEKTKILI